MATAPVTGAVPTTSQAERIHQLFDEAAARHPGQADLLRGIERALVEQPDDSRTGWPEPVQPLVRELMAGVLEQGHPQQQRMLGVSQARTSFSW